MDGPKQMLRNIFYALIPPSTLEHRRQQGKIHHDYNYFILCDN